MIYNFEYLQGDFCELKKKYEEACKQLEEDINETVEFMQVQI